MADVVPEDRAVAHELEVGMATMTTLVLDLLAALAADDEIAGVGVWMIGTIEPIFDPSEEHELFPWRSSR